MAHKRLRGEPAATNERKRRDPKLLEGLDALLKSLRADEPLEPKPPDREQPASGNLGQQKTQKGRKQQRRQEVRQVAELLKEPKGVLQRLEGFLEAGKRGQNGRRSTAERDEQETEKMQEPVPKRERKGPKVQKHSPRPLEKGRAKNKSRLRRNRRGLRQP